MSDIADCRAMELLCRQRAMSGSPLLADDGSAIGIVCIARATTVRNRIISPSPSTDRALRPDAGVEKSKRSPDIRNRAVRDGIYYRESHWQSRVLRNDLH
jgi:hypothetical protein